LKVAISHLAEKFEIFSAANLRKMSEQHLDNYQFLADSFLII